MEEAKSNRNSRDERLVIMGRIAKRTEQLLQGIAAQTSPMPAADNAADPLNLSPILQELTRRVIKNPSSLLEMQLTLWQDYIELWQKTSTSLLGQKARPSAMSRPSDRRADDTAWNDEAIFRVIKQSYLLTARWMAPFFQGAGQLDRTVLEKIDFYTRQFTETMALSQFVTDNAEIVQATFASGGDNILRGFSRLLEDLGDQPGRPAGAPAVRLGETLAATPGKVVFQNELLQLIHYAPKTAKVHRRPLLLIPPWTHRHYIFDLGPGRSFVDFALDQGLTVFAVSWAEADGIGVDRNFEDYLSLGVTAAIEAIELTTGEQEINAVGHGLGGTLLITALAQLSAKGDKRLHTATLLNTMIDFDNPGDLGVCVDDEQLAAIDQLEAEGEDVDGDELATTFNMLRANDLIWSFVLDTYRLGDAPFPLELLHWLADGTGWHHALQRDYLRHFYQGNNLVKPGKLTLNGSPIDLKKVRKPVYVLAAREDHLAPWMSSYTATQLLRGNTTFVLTRAGHVAGMIDPPQAGEDGHLLHGRLPEDPKDWLESAKLAPGSWWSHWQGWISRHGGPMIDAPQPGGGKLEPLEEAPGRFAQPGAV